MDPSAIFDKAIKEHLRVIETLLQQRPKLERIAERMSRAIASGNKILWCGNGGSAADAQHMAAELVGRFLQERRALPSMALSTNTSIVTAIGNDYGYEHVFQRQVEAGCVKGDVVVGISTSGSSPNVVLALEAAAEIGAFTLAMTGKKHGKLAEIADETLQIDSVETPRIQEGHVLCGHMICDYIERYICASPHVDASPEGVAVARTSGRRGDATDPPV